MEQESNVRKNLMKIEVRVKTGSKLEKVEKISDNVFKIEVSTRPTEGKANIKIIELIAEYYNIPKTLVGIVSGKKSKIKILEISI